MTCLFGTPAALLGNGSGNGLSLSLDEDGWKREGKKERGRAVVADRTTNDIRPGRELLLWQERRGEEGIINITVVSVSVVSAFIIIAASFFLPFANGHCMHYITLRHAEGRKRD